MKSQCYAFSKKFVAVMENSSAENVHSAKSSDDVVEKNVDDENNFENAKPNNLSSAKDGKNKDFGHKGRNVGKQICRFYMNQNYCRYGRNCRFSHDRSGCADDRNSGHEQVPFSGDLNTNKNQIGNSRGYIRKKRETEGENRIEKGTGCLDASPSISKRPGKHNSVVRQHSDVSADLRNKYQPGVQTLHQSNVMGRQRNLFFYRSNRGAASNSPGFRTRESNLCYYFSKGFCRQGDKCKFVHQGNNTDNAEDKTEAKPIGESSTADEKSTNEISSNLQPPCSMPVTGRHVKLRDLDQSDIVRLRNIEIQQLKKRFPAHEIVKSSPEEIFHVAFSPSDPDWSFAVNSISLEVAFSTGYPREACTVKALEANNLPPILVRHLNKSISDWIEEKHGSCLASGKVELLFRPFLRWLDRNLEKLFIIGLRKVKQDLLAKEAGIEFIPYDELPGATSKVHGDMCGTQTTKCAAKDKHDTLMSVQEFNDTGLTAKEECDELGNVEHVQDVDEKESPNSNIVQEKQTGIISEPQTDYSSTSAERENFSPDLNDAESTASRENYSLLVSAFPSTEKFSVPKVGTEIKLLSLELTESAAAMICTKIAATLQCSRCKTRHEINTPPKRNNSLNCIKCHHLMQIAFQSAMLHQFSTVMGYLHLIDCQAVDIPLMECNFHVDCLNCSRQISVSGIHYGQQRITWCLYCNKKISIYTQSVKFHQLQPSPNIGSPGHKLTTATTKEKKVIKDPAIQEGKPLPDCGTCKHYKKSYRWLRFPCCGKAYPCDLCHDEKESDHEMKYASRMICGFCAKEQPYAGSRPCVSCSSNMTKKAGSHWEGGKGCRDKLTMSREDHQKYAGMGKTISRKAQTQKPSKK